MGTYRYSAEFRTDAVALARSSLTMFLSVVRIWLIYSPRIYWLLRPLRPLEGWVYKTLRAAPPRSGNEGQPESSAGSGQSPKS